MEGKKIFEQNRMCIRGEGNKDQTSGAVVIENNNNNNNNNNNKC